jgi:hypothetical protein
VKPNYPNSSRLKLSPALDVTSTNSHAQPSDARTAPSLHNKTYAVVLKIVYGLKIHNALLKLRESTKSAIENQAREYIYAKYHGNTSLCQIWTSQLLSVVVKEQETDVSGYEDDDLTFLLKVISQHDLSHFTVKVSCTTV